jgi:recombination DNA repair RAD52 pathway protein
MNSDVVNQVQQEQKHLEKEFPTNQILKRQGDGGKTINYLEAATVAQRLNDVFGYKWSIEVISEQVEGDEVVVKVRLKVTDGEKSHVKEAYGGTTRKRKRNGDGYANCLADDLKAAQSDAFKKAASLFGIGLYLYSSTGLENSKSQEENYEQHSNVTHLSRSGGYRPSSQPAPTTRPATAQHGTNNAFGGRPAIKPESQGFVQTARRY